MRTILALTAFAVVQQAQAGAGLEEEDYVDLADIIVEASVSQSDCLSFVDGADTLETDYKATLTITNVLKGDSVGDELELISTVIEYKGDQPSCGANGRIHPSGEIARFYLVETDEDGVYKDVDQFSTYPLPESSPQDNPVCLDTAMPQTEDSKGCSVTQAAPSVLLWLPLIAVSFRRRR